VRQDFAKATSPIHRAPRRADRPALQRWLRRASDSTEAVFNGLLATGFSRPREFASAYNHQRLDDEHRVAVAVEAVLALDRVTICLQDQLATGERRDQHQKR